MEITEVRIKLMDEPLAEGDIFNVGNEHEITILDLARKVKEMTGSSSEIEYVPYEKAYGPGFEDMERRYPNIDKIRKLIQYEPRYDIDAIVK